MKGLFINSKAKKCSIHESGKMIYNCLLKSTTCKFDYTEIDVDNRIISTGYDIYFFNYHYGTMSWLNIKQLKKDFGFVMTVVLEVLPSNPFPLVDENSFDIYCAIDPTMDIPDKKVFAFPRPLEPFEIPQEQDLLETPIIGSFGLPTAGKGFEKIVEAVNEEFDKAIIKINMPAADFVSNSVSIANEYEDKCMAIAKKGIEIKVTHDFLTKDELIKWCRSNTINCFFYDRNQPGLSATTDQAISSERPLLVSDNETFRHVTHYLKPYPECSIKEAIENSVPVVRQIKKDWSQDAFAQKFDEMIEKIRPQLDKTKLKNIKRFKLKKNISLFKKIGRKILKKVVNTKKFQRWHKTYSENFEEQYKTCLENQGYIVLTSAQNNKIVTAIKKTSKQYSIEMFNNHLPSENYNFENLKKHKMVHISTYETVCGIGDYCKLLKTGLDNIAEFKTNDIISLDINYVKTATANEVDNYYSNIAQQCKDYDTVILQHEYSFFLSKECSFESANESFIKFLTQLNNSSNIKNILVIIHSSPDLAQPFSLESKFWSSFAKIQYLKKVTVLSTNCHMTNELAKYGILSSPIIVPVEKVMEKHPNINNKIKEDIKHQLLLNEGDIVLSIVGF
ncbi:MAG: hypothetical protein WCG95_05295, partial [bacterium]